MPRVRLDLDQSTFDALVEAATAELRPIAWQAEVMLRRVLGIRPRSPDSSLLPQCDEEVTTVEKGDDDHGTA